MQLLTKCCRCGRGLSLPLVDDSIDEATAGVLSKLVVCDHCLHPSPARLAPQFPVVADTVRTVRLPYSDS